jgi:hypothetical protein
VRLILSTVTQEDILTYFKGGSWQVDVRRSGMITCESKKWTVELEPQGDPLFSVEIHALEDEHDSDEMVTDKPVKFIEEFIQGEAPKLSSNNPKEFADLLQNVAYRVSVGMIGPKTLSRMLRRASILPNLHAASVMLFKLIRIARSGTDDAKKLVDELKQKGWTVEFKKNELNIPTILVTISDTFEANIELTTAQWTYWFSERGKEKDAVHGVTDDPIEEFNRFKDSVRDTEAHHEIPRDKKVEREMQRDVRHHGIPKNKIPSPIEETEHESWKKDGPPSSQ